MKCFLWKHDWEEVARQFLMHEDYVGLTPAGNNTPITIITLKCKNHPDKFKQVRLDGWIKKESK